jgi:hypothetical protein
LLTDSALAGFPNPAAKLLDLAIQQEQGSTSAARWINNTLRGEHSFLQSWRTRS